MIEIFAQAYRSLPQIKPSSQKKINCMSLIFNLFILILILCASLPLLNMLAILFGYPSLLSGALSAGEQVTKMTTMGQMGDFFGGHTAAFSGLLSACVIIHFSLQQVKIAKQTADLTSLSKIYDHYNDEYAVRKEERHHILRGIARGHRRWAIRESFSIIDPQNALELERCRQVESDFDQLIKLCENPENVKNYPLIAELCGSLLLDKRLVRRKRLALWPIYELLRKNVANIDNSNSEEFQVFAYNLRLIHRRFEKGFSY